jgi:hypothetical protein
MGVFLLVSRLTQIAVVTESGWDSRPLLTHLMDILRILVVKMPLMEFSGC